MANPYELKLQALNLAIATNPLNAPDLVAAAREIEAYLSPAPTAKTFKPGDVVTLKSGGPRMTVCDYTREGPAIVGCEWFRGGVLERDAFDAVNLRALG